MRESDLAAAKAVCEAAFKTVLQELYQRPPERDVFSDLLPAYRLAAGPGGCHVAEEGGELIGVNFSVARGSAGYFGPLAVAPEKQGSGVAQALVRECVASWERRGVALMGLETFPTSSLHIHLYGKLGFVPGWVGIPFGNVLEATEWPEGVEVDGPAPHLGYLYPGFDPADDVAATRSQRVGVTLRSSDGFAILHTRQTLWPSAAGAFLTLAVAPDAATFTDLIAAAEHLAAHAGRTRLHLQVPGGAWETQQLLRARGYREGGASLRLKRGPSPDYDARGVYYSDDWH